VTRIMVLFPTLVRLDNDSLQILPRISSRRVKFKIRRIRKHYGWVIVLPEALYIDWRVFNVKIGADSGFVFHETEVPIGNSMMLEPCRSLANCAFVKILDVKAMGDDANADVPVGKTSKCGWCTSHGTELSKQISLRYTEAVDVFILLFGRNTPLAKTVRRLGRERIEGHTKPLGNDDPKSIVEIRHNAV
jgi:hypothetical protein